MRKRVLILEGSRKPREVSVDGAAYRQFLMSPYGGCWREDDVECIPAARISENGLKEKLNELRGLEYFIFVYCGAQENVRKDGNQIQLCLKEQETISVDDVSSIADKQLSIIDCCQIDGGAACESIASLLQVPMSTLLGYPCIRRKYDELVQKACPGRYVLYTCPPGVQGEPRRDVILSPLAVMKHIESPNSKKEVDFIEAGEALRIASILAGCSCPGVGNAHPLAMPDTPNLPWLVNPSGIYTKELEDLASMCQSNRGMRKMRSVTQGLTQQKLVQR